MRVGIIGAGIGGLVTALGLQRHGADVVVLERDPAPRPSGSGLSVFGNGWTALDAVGVGDAARAVAGDQVTLLTAGQRQPSGRWITTASPASVAALRVVHRADLHRVLAGGLPAGVVRHGREVVGVDQDGTTVTVRDTGGTHDERFDVVVAADGIRSVVRSSWPDDPGTRYAGYSAWRGVTDHPVDLRGEAGETWGRGLRFGIAPLRDGRVYWFGVATMPADVPHRTGADEHARVTELFAGWHAPIAEILTATTPSTVFRLPIEDLARPLATFRRGRTVLLGDAAHAMTPDLGQGGNQAMEDGATLAALLAPLAADDAPAPGAVDEALRRYDVERRRRVQPIARRARAVGRVAQARGPVASRLRDVLLGAVPSSAADRQVAAIQAWRPPTG